MPTSPTLRRPRQRLVSLAAGLAIAAGGLGLSACGSSSSKPSVSAVQSKLSKEQELSSQLNATELHCLAGVLQQYVPASELEKYVDGKITVDQIKAPSNASAKTKAQDCVKKG